MILYKFLLYFVSVEDPASNHIVLIMMDVHKLAVEVCISTIIDIFVMRELYYITYTQDLDYIYEGFANM